MNLAKATMRTYQKRNCNLQPTATTFFYGFNKLRASGFHLTKDNSKMLVFTKYGYMNLIHNRRKNITLNVIDSDVFVYFFNYREWLKV